MSSSKIWRSYTVRFDGRPSILQIQNELTNAVKAMNEYTDVWIEHNGSSSAELEEITFTMEAEK